jgi:hypothetical protein
MNFMALEMSFYAGFCGFSDRSSGFYSGFSWVWPWVSLDPCQGSARPMLGFGQTHVMGLARPILAEPQRGSSVCWAT